MTNQIKAIVTMPPYAEHLNEVLEHDKVSGIRLNTVMPIKGKLEDTLKKINDSTKEKGKDLWIDLKCRQLRIKNFGVPPFTEVELSHEIEVYTPCKAYFSERGEEATVLEVEGNKLIMKEGPRRVVGPGESVTITHPTLKIKGYLTEGDKKYIDNCNKLGINKFMLSFVEQKEDIEELLKYSPNAEIISKIESKKGLDFVKDFSKNSKNRLMAARGDLYMQLHWPHKIIDVLENILYKDESAIVASRILDSLSNNSEPTCEDIGDLDNLLRMGYKTVMFGDYVCLDRRSIISALNIFSVMSERYERK